MDIVIGNILSFIFGSNSFLGTFVISMMPLVELMGGIPIGMSRDFWGVYALNGVQAFLVSLLGSSTIIFILPLIFIPILNYLKKTKLFRKIGLLIEEKVSRHSEDLLKNKKSTFLKCLGIFLFVLLPVPLSGVWTGCCVAVAIGLDYWQTVCSVFFGNLLTAIMIVGVCAIFPSFTTWLTYIVLGLILIIVITAIIKTLIRKKKGINTNK